MESRTAFCPMPSTFCPMPSIFCLHMEQETGTRDELIEDGRRRRREKMEEGEGERRWKIARWKMEEVKTTPNDQSNINFLN